MHEGLNIRSEIGRLRKVMLYRPGNELLNLSPDTLGPLLFDDIPFLEEAQREHDCFARMLTEEGVEVLYLDELVAEALDAVPGACAEFCERWLDESGLPGRAARAAVRELLHERGEHRVEQGDRGAQLIFSRGNAAFIEYLFRQEVPELETGAVEIMGIAREAGRRTKIAVRSNMAGADPVGTFVGGRGVRVQAVINEIGDRERIDVINWSDNPSEYIREALSPAEVARVEIDGKKATVYVKEDQQSIAIGRQGQNVRLASKLTGYDLDVELLKKTAPRKRKNAEDALLSALEAAEAAETDEAAEATEASEVSEATEAPASNEAAASEPENQFTKTDEAAEAAASDDANTASESEA